MEADRELAIRITIGFMEQMQASNISPPTALLAALNCAALLSTRMELPDKLSVKLFRDLLQDK